MNYPSENKTTPEKPSGLRDLFYESPFGALLAALLVFCVILLPLYLLLGKWYKGILLNEERSRLAIQLGIHGNAIAESLNQRFARLEGLYAFVLANPSARSLASKFDIFAAGLHAGSKGIRNFALAPGGIQRYVYPLRGNEAVLGHDLLGDTRPEVREDVRRAMEKRETTLSGPYELRQDGFGIVARKAVFFDNRFWGLATMVIDIPPILKDAGLSAGLTDMETALRDVTGRIFYGDGRVFEARPVIHAIALPEGRWELAGIPKQGWDAAIGNNLLIFRGTGLIVAFLISWLVYLSLNRQRQLRRAVKEGIRELLIKNQALLESEEYTRTLFELSPIGLALCRMDGSLVEVNSAYARIIGWTVEETLKLTYWDITPEKYAEQEQQQLHALTTTGRYGPYEKEYIHKDGRLVPVRLQGLIIKRGGEDFIWSSVEDITESKKAEDKLRRNEAVLRLFVEYSPAAIAMFDLDMKYIAASRRYLADYELGDQDLAGRHHYEVFPEMPERWKEIHSRCLAGAIERCDEDPFLRADGTLDWVKWEIRPWYEFADKIGGIILFSEVITERKKAEEELRITNEELRAVNRIIATTAAASGVNEILEKVMGEALNITGLEGGTICLVTSDETLHIAAHRATSDATIRDLTTNEIKIGECLCGECARDHKPLILRDREAVLDYSTREAQRDEDIRFHAAFPLIASQTCLGVLCVFTRTDRKPPERSLKLLETVTAQIAMAIDNARLYEETLRDAAILENKVKERTATIQDSQKALANLVDDLNMKTAKIQAANERLQELDRLKSMFIASMSHELRTPLNSIIGFTGIILMGMSGPISAVQKKQLGMVKNSANHLLALINDVIDMSKIEAGKVDLAIEGFEFAILAGEVAESFAVAAAEKGLRLDLKAADGISVRSDRRRVRQILVNLVGNAIKFTETGTVAISVADIGDKAEIRVRDTGIGMQLEDMDKLFEAFSRIHIQGRPVVEGTGLGLYLCRRIAALLGGEITAESEPGRGSEFTFCLPKAHTEGKR